MSGKRSASHSKGRRNVSRAAGISSVLVLLFCIFLIGMVANRITATDRLADSSAEHDCSWNAERLLQVKGNPDMPGIDVVYKGMTMSFNPKAHVPNWVAWELTADEADGTEPRANNFQSDPDVPGCPTLADYRGSGYDRGHMAPAADMKWDPEAMAQSFLLTNMCPQDHALNAGSWKKLEEKCRIWAMADSAIIIIAGPVLTDPVSQVIGENMVVVPDRFFKVILSPYRPDPKGIGFIMPNSRVPGGMQACAVSIDSVESVTGIDFFSDLPDDIESDVESQCKFSYWANLRP